MTGDQIVYQVFEAKVKALTKPDKLVLDFGPKKITYRGEIQ